MSHHEYVTFKKLEGIMKIIKDVKFMDQKLIFKMERIKIKKYQIRIIKSVFKPFDYPPGRQIACITSQSSTQFFVDTTSLKPLTTLISRIYKHCFLMSLMTLLSLKIYSFFSFRIHQEKYILLSLKIYYFFMQISNTRQ